MGHQRRRARSIAGVRNELDAGLVVGQLAAH